MRFENNQELYMIINNFAYLSKEDKVLFYQLGLHKYPNTGIYRKNWEYFIRYINHQTFLSNSRNYASLSIYKSSEDASLP